MKSAPIFTLLAALAVSEAFILQFPALGCRTRSVALHSSGSSEKESISQLIKEYRKLQDQLRADLQEGRQFEASYDAEAMLDKEMEITARQIEKQEATAMAAQEHMNQAIKDVARANELKDQALEEAKWAIDETTFLESLDSKHAELESLLLAHAAHDMKETDDLLTKAEKEKQDALRQEVQAKDLLWYLVQKEENLKELQAPHNKKELAKWAEDELGRHESMVKVLKKKLKDHDPTTGQVSF